MAPVSRTIVLTGVSRGLGEALAAEFVARGHVVWGCCRSAERVAAWRRAHPSPHDWSVVDVTAGSAVAAWAERLLAGGGVPDLLLNNAAVVTGPAPLWTVPAVDFDQLVDINLKGVANVIRAFVPAMVARRRGIIVNFSSGWGRSVSPGVAPYCASKWAIEGLSKAMAEEVPEGMAVIPLNPGIIATDMLRVAFGPSAEDYEAPRSWARKAAPFLLHLGPRDNGRSLTVPGAAED